MARQQITCENLNHSRGNPPFRFCKDCGVSVNQTAPQRYCDESAHNAKRREREVYCVDCGQQLIASR